MNETSEIKNRVVELKDLLKNLPLKELFKLSKILDIDAPQTYEKNKLIKKLAQNYRYELIVIEFKSNKFKKKLSLSSPIEILELAIQEELIDMVNLLLPHYKPKNIGNMSALAVIKRKKEELNEKSEDELKTMIIENDIEIDFKSIIKKLSESYKDFKLRKSKISKIIF